MVYIMTNINNKIALLIDADNTSAKYIKTIIDELNLNYGVISVKFKRFHSKGFHAVYCDIRIWL